jgi:hypothetical protein
MLPKHTSQPTRSLSLAEARFTFGGIQPKEDKNNDLNFKAGNRFLPSPLGRRIMLQQN